MGLLQPWQIYSPEDDDSNSATPISTMSSLSSPSLTDDPTESGRRMDVIAPSGKLGVILDSSHGGAPTVHVVKETSVIADMVKVGDRILAVDDESVQDMTAGQVSELLSSKSENAERKLSLLRTETEV